MTDDLIERLHSCEYVAYYDGEPGIVADEKLLHEAADRIETQANTIEELRSANERWVIAFNQAEERANGRIETLREALISMSQAAAGFALGVRDDNGMPYPWPALDIADAQAEAALQETGQ